MAILSELLKSFKGAPKSSDVGRFEQGAIAGGRNVLGLDSLTNPTVEGLDPIGGPTKFNLAELAGAPTSPDMQLSLDDEFKQALQAMSAEPARSVKAGAPSSSVRRVSVSDSPLESLPEKSDPGNDQSIKSQRSKQSELDAAQKALSARADAPTSTEEQIAQLLVGILPGLLGMGIGGAVGGATGAAGGAAGGFSGSAEGLSQAGKIKREEKDKLFGRSAKLQDRIDELEKQIGVRTDRLEERDLSAAEAVKARNQQTQLTDKRSKLEANLAASQQGFTASENQKNRTLEASMKAEDIAQRDRDSARDFLAKKLALGAKTANDAGNRKEADLYTQASTAVDALDQLQSTVKQFGNWESSSSLSPFSDGAGAAKLDNAIENFAIAYAKITDPDSVVRPAEVENAKKMVPMGMFTKQSSTEEGIQLMRNIIKQKMEERSGLFHQPVPVKSVEGAPASASGANLQAKYGF